MTLRGNILLVALLAGSLIGVVACGDDDGSSSTNTTSSSSNSSSASSSSGAGGGTGGMGGNAGPDCMQLCTELFNCGLEDNGGMQLCVGFSDGGVGGGGGAGGGAAGVTEDQFVPGCITTCEDQPALGSLINPDNCPGTISTIKGVSSDFAMVCDGM